MCQSRKTARWSTAKGMCLIQRTMTSHAHHFVLLNAAGYLKG
jgi:hypothetical protein